jgi:RNA polymerase sigma-70 factor (ECF subfamily)
MEKTIFERAASGDDAAFEEIVRPYRRELLMHCYRILGSVQDAEDALQEVLVSAWRALDGFDGRSLRAWLYRIATNRSLNFLRDESRRPNSISFPGNGWPSANLTASDEPWWLEPFPDALMDEIALGPEARYDDRESVALSFVAGLQRLPPLQRAVLVLRDVMGFPASEVSTILGATPASVNSALSRARAGLQAERDVDRIPLPRSREESQVIDRFVDAFQHGDLEEVVAILTEDARLTMPPEPFECIGPQAIVEFLQELGCLGPRLVATRTNNQPAFGYYFPDPHSRILRVRGLLVLTLRDTQVSALTRFGDTGILARCGLPRTLSS